MHRRSYLLIAAVALLIGLVAVLSMAGLRKPDSVSSATMAPPTITGLTPLSGQVGSQVQITGTVFGNTRGTNVIRFNGKAVATYVSWSATQVVCKVPTGAKTGPVTVTTGGGTSNGSAFTVTAAPPPPPPAKTAPAPTWYLAEGTSNWGFDCRVNIENPNATAVTARITYMTDTGPIVQPDIALPALSQTTVYPGDAIGPKDYSTKVQCLEGRNIAVDRTMTWTGPGAASAEAHSSVGVTQPATTWYLAEGSSSWGFECWLLIQNPNASAANCDATYMIEGSGPKTVRHVVPGNSRASYNMFGDIGAKDASIKVVSNVPVIPERAMYRNNRREGHDSIGTTTPANDYYLAEGTTGWGFTTYVLVQNPNPTPTTVTITYMTAQYGLQVQPAFNMPANSRKTIKVNDTLKGLDFSTQIHGALPIIGERAMYWDNGTGESCHDSIGMDTPHTTFYLPDGQSSDGWETWTLVQNPNPVPVIVRVYYLTNTGTGNVTFTDTIPASSRKSYNMGDKLPQGRASVLVTSLTTGRLIMVERAMYWNNRGAGTDTIGGYSD
ncbi:MAG TPA: IPT/TIG domain-containing protein [Candidatus Anoxymicrobiaceae bacterium]